MEIQVVGGIDRLVRVGDGTGVIRQTIEQGSVDLEQSYGLAGLLQAVIDDGGDIPLIRTVRLLFNEGGDDDHILHAVTHGFGLGGGERILVDTVSEGIDQLTQSILGIVILVELIGVREQVALQTAGVFGIVVDEAVIVCGGPDGLQQIFFRIDALFRQQTDGLPHGIALGDGDGDSLRRQVAGGVVHAQDQRPVIHLRIQCIGADADLFVGMGDPGIELEKPLVLDEPCILELIRHGGHAVLRRHLHRGLPQSTPVEGAEIRAQHPAHTRQNSGSQQDKDQVTDQHRQRIPSPPAVTAFAVVSGCRLPPRPLRLPDLLCVPAGSIISSEFRHWFLLAFPVPGREGEYNFRIFVRSKPGFR